MAFFSELAQTPWITFISIALALIGLISSVFFYYKGRKTKLIRYYLYGNSLFEGFVEKIKGLSIQFYGKQIKTLTVTKIRFWNNGTETINHNDFPTNDPFSINIQKGYEILDASIMKSNNTSNNVKINLSDAGFKIDVDFEYLDPKDEFIIQIFHTGTEDSNDFKVFGSIKRFGKIFKGKVNSDRLSTFLFLATFAMYGIIMLMMFSGNTDYIIIPSIIVSVLVATITLSIGIQRKIMKKKNIL